MFIFHLILVGILSILILAVKNRKGGIFCCNRQNLLSVTKVICQQQSLTPLGNSKPKTLTHGEITHDFILITPGNSNWQLPICISIFKLAPGIYSMHAIFSIPLEIPYPQHPSPPLPTILSFICLGFFWNNPINLIINNYITYVIHLTALS